MSRNIYDSTTEKLIKVAGSELFSDNFIGTFADWDSLTVEEKNKYTTMDFTNDYEGMPVDPFPTKNSIKPAQSGGLKNYVDSGAALKADSVNVPLKTQISNLNLLDNPWFTVNQRGLTDYGITGGYTVDRWYLATNGRGGISNVSSDGITINALANQTPILQQKTERTLKSIGVGRDLTLSVMYPDGRIVKTTGKIEDSSYTIGALLSICSVVRDGVLLNISIFEDGNGLILTDIELENTTESEQSVDIRAIKLEIGSISTLSMDTAPNYSTELAKCQRYFIRVGKLYPVASRGKPLSYSIAHDTNEVWFPLYLPVSMRFSPKMENVVGDIRVTTITNTSGLIGSNADGSIEYSVVDYNEKDCNIILINAHTEGLYTAGTKYKLMCANADLLSYYDLSADL